MFQVCGGWWCEWYEGMPSVRDVCGVWRVCGMGMWKGYGVCGGNDVCMSVLGV